MADHIFINYQHPKQKIDRLAIRRNAAFYAARNAGRRNYSQAEQDDEEQARQLGLKDDFSPHCKVMRRQTTVFEHLDHVRRTSSQSSAFSLWIIDSPLSDLALNNGHQQFSMIFPWSMKELVSLYPGKSQENLMEELHRHLGIMYPIQLPYKVSVAEQNSILSFLVASARERRDLFNCVLACALAMAPDRLEWTWFKPVRSVHHILAYATSILQPAVSKDYSYLDDATLVAVLHITLAHVAFRNPEAFQAHYNGARAMIALRGGLSDTNPDRYIRTILGFIEYTAAVWKYILSSSRHPLGPQYHAQIYVVPSPPQVRKSGPPSSGVPLNRGSLYAIDEAMDKYLSYPRHPFDPEICAAVSRLPPPLEKLSVQGELTNLTIVLLSHMAKWSSLTLEVRNSLPLSSPDLVFRLYCDYMECGRAAVVALLALPLVSDHPLIDHVICLAATIAIRGRRNAVRPEVVHLKLFADYLIAIHRIDAENERNRDLVIWCSSLVAYGSSEKRFEKQLTKLLDYVLKEYCPGWQWENIDHVLQDYPWYEIIRKEYKSIWQSALSRPKGESVELDALQTMEYEF